MTSFTKKRLRAVIVGMERYEQDNLADLDGPAMDAVSLAVWLHKSGVPSENIALFIEPLPRNESICHSTAADLQWRRASSKDILTYLREHLITTVSEILIVFWAGHGTMLANEDRLVFFCDSDNEVRSCINLRDLLTAMASKTYAGHSNIHFFVDACSDFLKPNENFTSVTLLPHAQAQVRNIRAGRFALFSASPGEQSGNAPGTRSGLASSALMESLAGVKFWPEDPSELYNQVEQRMQPPEDKSWPISQHAYVTRIYPRGSTSELTETSGILGDSGTMHIMAKVGAASSSSQTNSSNLLGVELEDGFSRFRRKSQKAFANAGKVPPSNLSGKAFHFAEGIYVQRDLEPEVVAAVTNGRMVTPIKGAPGVGKTSLLWGVGSELSRSSWDVLFVQAPWLIMEDEGVRGGIATHLVGTARASKAQGNSVVTLIDTADALISQSDGLEALEQLVELLTAEEVAVVITCRPEEAEDLPDEWSEELPSILGAGLGDFSILPMPGRPHSEFELAVASHARAYKTRTGHPTEILIHQLVNAVSRRKPMARFCLRPLFLRMLFDLYAPFAVPENLSITMLYEQYWMDRVRHDRRNANRDDETKATDLSKFVMELGREMLKYGSPELRVSSIASVKGSHEDFWGQIQEVNRRGLGEVRDGIFTFFHQTFFEFAAAKSLLNEAGVSAVCVLLDRAGKDAGNYFVIAVLEQTWLCAWNDSRWQYVSCAIAEKALDEGHEGVAGAVRQATLNVIAQAPILTAALWTRFLESVTADAYDVFIGALRLLPTPSRLSGPQELDLCRAGMSRVDEGRSEALRLLGRLADADPEAIVPLIDASLPFVPKAGRDLEHTTIKLVASLVPYAPLRVLTIMSSLTDHAVRTSQSGILQVILSELVERPGLHSPHVAFWCSERFKNADAKLQRFLAQIHAQGLAVELDNGGRERAIEAFWQVCARLVAGKESTPPQSDRDVFAGTLLAAVHPELANTIPKFITTILLIDHPRMHSWLHYGLLVPILNSASGALVDFLALHAARGLPATSSNHQNADSRWSDTLRRSLARPDVNLTVIKSMAEEVERLLSMKFSTPRALWLETDYLLDILVRAAVAGVASAERVIQQLEAELIRLDPKVRSRLARGLRSPEGTSAEKLRALRLLVAFRNVKATKSLIESLERDELRGLKLPELGNLITVQLSHPDPAQREAGWDLIKISVLRGLSPWPEKSLHETEIVKSKGNPPLALVELLELGLSRLAYSPDDVVMLTSHILKTRKNVFHEKKESALRRTRVRALALAVPPAEWRQAIDEAFTPPIENNLIVNAASLLVNEHRPLAALTSDQKLQVLLHVGRRANELAISKVATKRAVTAWRRGISETLNGLPLTKRMEVLASLQQLNVDFSVEIATHLQIEDSDGIRELAQSVAADQQTEPRLRKVLQSALKRAWISAEPLAWVDLDHELDRHGRVGGCVCTQTTHKDPSALA